MGVGCVGRVEKQKRKRQLELLLGGDVVSKARLTTAPGSLEDPDQYAGTSNIM